MIHISDRDLCPSHYTASTTFNHHYTRTMLNYCLIGFLPRDVIRKRGVCYRPVSVCLSSVRFVKKHWGSPTRERVEARRRRRVGWVGVGKGYPYSQPTGGLGERRELPSGVRGGAPAANAFVAYFRVTERL